MFVIASALSLPLDKICFLDSDRYFSSKKRAATWGFYGKFEVEG